jgi:CelD/BcsL family acetyltransferase involved in cellulose biosynthesis
MPGYVTHALAIVRNKQKGMHVYDLMHGDALYKRMLCNRTETLHWLVLQRRRLKFRLEDLAVKAVRVGRRSVF